MSEEDNGLQETQEKTIEITASEAKAILDICQAALKVNGSLSLVPAVNHFQTKFIALFK